MPTDAKNVTAAKPKIGGAVSVAPLGTALPTNAYAALAAAFTSLGYISEEGLTNSNSPNSSDIYAWGGDKVLTTSSSKPDTFACTLIEATNVAVLKTAYGEENVTGTLATGITVKANNAERENLSYVIDTILRDGTLKRIVLPSASISSMGDIAYSDTSALGYSLTLSCEPDSAGNTHYEYIYSGEAPADDDEDPQQDGGNA